MSQPSLADCAVDALAQVRSIGQDMSGDHPMRHVVHSMKRAAETILADAMRQAVVLSYQADQLVKDHDAAIAQIKETP